MFNAFKWGGCGIRGWRLLEEGPVTSVAIPLPWQVVLQHTRKFTLGRSFSNVGAVTTHALQLVIWRPIQTLKLGRNPSYVAAATYHSVNLEVWWHIPGEKPYQCTSCDYSCTTSGGLKTHSYTHTRDKPFQCKSFWLFMHSIYTHTREKP